MILFEFLGRSADENEGVDWVLHEANQEKNSECY